MSTTFTGPQIDMFRLRVIRSAIGLYLKTGMKPNRFYTPKNMRGWAGGFTGKVYPASRRGLEMAYADLGVLMNTPTSA